MTSRRPGHRGPLSDEDVRLWEMMKQRLEPLHKPKRHVLAGESTSVAEPRSVKAPVAFADGKSGLGRVAKAVPEQRPLLAKAPAKPAAPVQRKTAFLAASAPHAPEIERRKSRRIAKGQHAIDAVIDLHGMRQREAHAALNGFIARSHANGCKFVKVITGKGARLVDDHAPHRPFDAPHAGERGVLKRLVPEWLREPALAHLVVGIASAGRGHGGEGALYVELRRKGRLMR